MDKVKVLYIAGTGRNGSTILDTILGQVDGFISVGEIHQIWQRGIIQQQLCGCGAPYRECEFWPRVIEEAFGSISIEEARKWETIKSRKTRLRRMIWYMLNGDPQTDQDLAKFLATLDTLYQTIASFHAKDHRIIVDSSKSPMYLGLLKLLPSLDIYTIHLVRDPRAVAYSWATPKESADPRAPEFMELLGLRTSCVIWDIWNPLIEYFGNVNSSQYMPLKYERFSSDPLRWTKNIMAFLKVDAGQANLPFEGDRTAFIGKTHTISGNPARFRTGLVGIAEDTRWHREMQLKDKLVATVLTLPLLGRYDYRIDWRRACQRL